MSSRRPRCTAVCQRRQHPARSRYAVAPSISLFVFSKAEVPAGSRRRWPGALLPPPVTLQC